MASASKGRSDRGGPAAPAPAARAIDTPPVQIVRPAVKRTVRRHAEPYAIVEKIKLWPSKTGLLHGVRSVKLRGGFMEIQTHCGQSARIRNSRNSRVARHLRNKLFDKPCPRCRVPAWKVKKFEETAFI